MIALAAALICLAPNDAEVLLAKVRNAYLAVRSAEFYVRFEANDPTGIVAQGELRCEYQAPSKFRVAYRGLPKGPALLICDGKDIAMFAPDGKKTVVQFWPARLGRDVPTNLETISFFDANHELSIAKGGGMEGSTLTLLKNQEYAKKQYDVIREVNNEDQVEVDYYIDHTNLLIWHTLGIDLATKKTFIDASIVQLDLNKKIDPIRFHIPKKSEKPGNHIHV